MRAINVPALFMVINARYIAKTVMTATHRNRQECAATSAGILTVKGGSSDMLSNYQDMFRGYEVTLDSGIVISMEWLHQQITYLSILEGLPDRRFNDGLIRKLTGKGFHLLYQQRSELQINGEPARRTSREFEFLPSITCTSSWRSLTPARDPEADLSSLSLVWFQDAWALPLIPEVEAALKALDWNNLAADGWF
jgi:hypothetical protein